MSKKFKVTGIPTLVFVDGKTGSLITADGRSIVGDDPEGTDFPWKPKPFTEVIKSGKFVNKDKEEKTWDDFQGKTIFLYFSAHWVSHMIVRPTRPFFPSTFSRTKINVY